MKLTSIIIWLLLSLNVSGQFNKIDGVLTMKGGTVITVLPQGPNAPIITSTGNGSIPEGEYKYFCTWVGKSHGIDHYQKPLPLEETAAGQVAVWISDGKSQAVVSKPTSQPPLDATGWRVYRSKIGGEVDPVVNFIHFYVLTEAIPLTTLSYTDNANDSELKLDGGELSSTYGTRNYIENGIGSLNGTYNTAYGWNSLQKCTVGQFNSAFGRGGMGNLTSGKFNSACGCDALKAVTTGNYNVAMGVDCIQGLTTGQNNVAMGFGALNASNGDGNVAIGQGAVAASRTVIGNTGVGWTALYNSSGLFNVGIGAYGGRDITTGAYNTFLGTMSGYGEKQKKDVNASTAIGYKSYTTKDNQVVIGGDNVKETVLKGNVKIKLGESEYTLQEKIYLLEQKMFTLEQKILRLERNKNYLRKKSKGK